LAEKPYWIVGQAITPVGEVPRVATQLEFRDRLGAFRSRTGAYRMSYTVSPGLYAAGTPGAESEVLVTANYKLSFDSLRKHLSGRDAWILVLDTHGINVWCAAGKRTFGTEELVQRLERVELHRVVKHRRLILPQLSAPGVSAPLVRKRSGFKVHYGPVRASDLPAYLDSGLTATDSMRRVRFTMMDRFILTPMEIRPAMKYFPLFALAVFVLFGLQPSGVLFRDAWVRGYPFLLLGLGSVLSGALITPVFLPYIPFRSFAIKGWITGALLSVLLFLGVRDIAGMPRILVASAGFLFPSLSSYIALQFTGSTTFTGMSGVQKELRIGLPLYIISGVVAVGAVLFYKFSQWGIV